MPRFQVKVNKCPQCDKTVYPLEAVLMDTVHFHKACFRCRTCNRTLSTGSCASLDGAFYCKPHFLQLFRAKGNYEEGFGKERYKNKWNTPNGKSDVPSETEPQADTEKIADVSKDAEEEQEVRERVVNGPVALEQPKALSNKTIEHLNSFEDCTEGVEEESGPISLAVKKTRLFEKQADQKSAKKDVPGKLKTWNPVTSSNAEEVNKSRPEPKKLSINWAERTKEREVKRGEAEQPLKFNETETMRNQFEPKESEKNANDTRVREEELSSISSGLARAKVNMFENPSAYTEFDETRRKELEELKLARSNAAQNASADDVIDSTQTQSDESARYRELNEFAKTVSTRDKLISFERGHVETNNFKSNSDVDEELGSDNAKIGLQLCSTTHMKDLFESGALLNTPYHNEEKRSELVNVSGLSNAEAKRIKFESFESGDSWRKDIGSDLPADISCQRQIGLYESGDSIATSGGYSSQKKIFDENVPHTSTSAIKDQYRSAVAEGNRIMTSAPVTITKAQQGEQTDEAAEPPVVMEEMENETDPTVDSHSVSLTDSPAVSDDEYVAVTAPKKLTNVEELFKKPEMTKEAPVVNKIVMPTFRNSVSSDEDIDEDARKIELTADVPVKKTSSLKDLFENKNIDADEPKEAPQPIDLAAEINAYKQHMKMNRPRRHKSAKNITADMPSC